MNQIRAGYSKPKYQDELVTIGYHVLEKMENNEAFLPPPPALEELKIVIPEFQAALANARGRDMVMVALKNNKKEIVVDLLEKLSDYVTTVCKGNITLILSSGFDAINDGRNSSLPVSIEILEVKLGLPGEATTKVRKVSGARAYMHQYTTDPPGLKAIWISEGSGLSSYTFRGLNSEKRYWFRVIALGSGTQKAYSPIVSMVIQ